MPEAVLFNWRLAWGQHLDLDASIVRLLSFNPIFNLDAGLDVDVTWMPAADVDTMHDQPSISCTASLLIVCSSLSYPCSTARAGLHHSSHLPPASPVALSFTSSP